MKKPLLSIVVPVYNTSPWLRKCLDSIINQTYRNIEIICVDDGSTDDSLAVLQQYAVRDFRIKVIHQENAGVSVARNRGVEVASGDYVGFVDSDDYLACNAFEIVVPYLEEKPDVVVFGIKGVDAFGKDVSSAYMDLPCEGVRKPDESLIIATNGYVWNKLFRLKLLRDNNVTFPCGIRYEDAMFMYIAMMFSEKVCYVKERVYYYLQHEGSFTQGECALVRASRFCYMLEALYQYMKRQNMLQRWGNLYRRLFLYYFEHPVHSLPGKQQRQLMMQFKRMVMKNGISDDFPGVYPYDELRKFSLFRSLFFWRNEKMRVYKFLKWPILRVSDTSPQKTLQWF